MTTLLTYAEFLAVFLGPPIALLLAFTWRARSLRLLAGASVLCALAVLYTTPWGNLLIGRGVWWYGDGAVLTRLLLVPVEEYAFMLLQTLLTVLWVALVRSRRTTATGDTPSTGVTADEDSWTALSWWTRAAGAAVGVPTVYLAAADSVAIELGIWSLSTQYTTGVLVAGLPIEEGAFFLVTNVFVVQGLLLYLWIVDPATAPAGTARGPPTSNRRSGGTSP